MTHLERPEAIRDIQTGDIKVYGHWFWDELDEVVSKIPCASCREGGRAWLQAGRDAIAIDTGKTPFNVQNLLEVQKRLNELVAKCHREGHCSPARKFLPHGLTECEKAHPSVQKKLSRCIRKLEPRERAGEIRSAVAVCRASVKCPPP